MLYIDKAKLFYQFGVSAHSTYKTSFATLVSPEAREVFIMCQNKKNKGEPTNETRKNYPKTTSKTQIIKNRRKPSRINGLRRLVAE